LLRLEPDKDVRAPLKNMILNPAIVIMAKVPRQGTVKTRLKPVLTDEQCVELSICFLKDAVNKAKKITPNLIVAFSPADGRNEIENLLPEVEILIEQKGNDLGKRMNAAFEFTEAKHFSPIIIIGTDSPDLPPEFINSAIELFKNDTTKFVLGAAKDGGYYLIGVRNPVDGIFENVEWSSAKTFAQTVKNARRIFACDVAEIPVWYDVDTPEDLKSLRDEFMKNENFAEIAPETAKWLKENKKFSE
jgi:uncharacterized protein